MRKIIALLLMLALVASLAMSSSLALAREGEGDSEHVGGPADEDEDLPEEEQEPARPEGGFTISDEVKVGIAAGIIAALVVLFVIWMKRGAPVP